MRKRNCRVEIYFTKDELESLTKILRMANARGMLDVPKLREALTENRKVEKMITAAYTMPED